MYKVDCLGARMYIPVGTLVVGCAELSRDGTCWYLDRLAGKFEKRVVVAFLILVHVQSEENFANTYKSDKGKVVIDDTCITEIFEPT